MYAAHHRSDALKYYGVAAIMGAGLGAVSSYLIFHNPKDDIAADEAQSIAAEELKKEKDRMDIIWAEMQVQHNNYRQERRELRAQEIDYDARLKLLEEREKLL